MYENMISVDRGARESLQKQIRSQIAIGIVNRQYPLDRRLPSIRRLARELGVSVTTVSLAYQGLSRDGFVEVRRGAGFFVNPDVLSEAGGAPNGEPLAGAEAPGEGLDYEAFFRGRSFNLPRVVKPADCLSRYRYPFVCGLIDPSLFPIDQWRGCVRDSMGALELGNWAAD